MRKGLDGENKEPAIEFFQKNALNYLTINNQTIDQIKINLFRRNQLKTPPQKRARD